MSGTRKSKRSGSNRKTQASATSKQATSTVEPVLEIDPIKLWKELPQSWLTQFGVTQQDFDTLREFIGLGKEEKTAAARKVVADFVINTAVESDPRFAFAIAESESLLDGYATLDDVHREEIKRLISRITAYLRDATRKRPFNALMLAWPGAGKSHFIKKLASTMDDERVQARTFNMETMQ